MSLPYVGNYSLQPGQVVPIPYLESNSKKRYLIGVQKGKPVLDEELSEAGFREFDLICKYLERNIGSAALGATSFKITESAITTVSNFSITGGTADDPATLVVKGYPALLFSTIEYNQQDATGLLTDDDYTKTLIAGISVPATDRIDAVYIDIYLAEVSSELGSEYQDATLKDSILAIQTANRFRIVQDILVSEGNTTIPTDGVDINGIYHRYYKLAEIQRHTGIANIYDVDITDTRTVVTSLKDISNGIGDIHVRNATVDNDLTVHGTVTIINTTETNAESLKITSDDAGVNAVEITKSNSGHALIINKTGSDHALIVNTGNSGFGTTNPTDQVTLYHGRLSIIGSYTGAPVIQLSGEDATAGILRTTNAVPLYLGANNVTRISIAPGTASVGIATDVPDPTVALDINGVLRMRSGVPASGSLLKSDANGVASWVAQNLISDDDWEKGTGTGSNNVLFNKVGGMVGIQTTAPSGAALDVNGLIKMRSGASLGKIIMSDADGVFSWISPTSISDGDWVITDTRMYNVTATVVGIGLSNPNPAVGKLQVSGAVYTNGSITCASIICPTITGTTGSFSTSMFATAVRGTTGSFSSNLTCVGLSAGAVNIVTLGTFAGGVFAGTSASLSSSVTCVGVNAGSGNIITTGNIGIGTTTSLTNKLHINGNMVFSYGADRTISVEDPVTSVHGHDLTIAASNVWTGASGSAFRGGDVFINGGNGAGSAGFSGGGVFIRGGSGYSTSGQVILCMNGLTQFGRCGIGVSQVTDAYTLCEIGGKLLVDGNIHYSSGADRDLLLEQPTTNVAGDSLTIGAANGGVGPATTAGGNLLLRAGDVGGSTPTGRGGYISIEGGGGNSGKNSIRSQSIFEFPVSGLYRDVYVSDASGNYAVGTLTSSIRYKENVRIASISDIEKIINVQPVLFNYKSDLEKREHLGFIAEEVDKLNLINTVFYDNEGRPDGINMSRFVPYLLGYIKILDARVIALENKIKNI